MLQVIAGHHPSDPDCVDAPFTAESAGPDLAGIRIGMVTENHISDQADPALRPTFEAAVGVLAVRGADVREVRLPYYQEVCTANIATITAEALAYHRGDLSGRWRDCATAAEPAAVHLGSPFGSHRDSAAQVSRSEPCISMTRCRDGRGSQRSRRITLTCRYELAGW